MIDEGGGRAVGVQTCWDLVTDGRGRESAGGEKIAGLVNDGDRGL